MKEIRPKKNDHCANPACYGNQSRDILDIVDNDEKTIEQATLAIRARIQLLGLLPLTIHICCPLLPQLYQFASDKCQRY